MISTDIGICIDRGVLTMRRKIVALSLRCFFSSALRFRFSLLAATRYSRLRCFRSHSASVHCK
jgi:hypothetical protein